MYYWLFLFVLGFLYGLFAAGCVYLVVRILLALAATESWRRLARWSVVEAALVLAVATVLTGCAWVAMMTVAQGMFVLRVMLWLPRHELTQWVGCVVGFAGIEPALWRKRLTTKRKFT